MTNAEHPAIERIVSPRPLSTEPNSHELRGAVATPELSLRPTQFEDYPGQDKAKDNLKIFVGAAKKRGMALDHVLLHGPPGLGKTSLARIIAMEMGVPFYQTSGPSIDKPGDLAGLLAGVEAGSVLFIDEIHRLSIAVEEVLYSAMEDFCMDIMVGQGATARSVRMPISRFTLIGATTRISLLSSPLLSRFGIQAHLEFYDNQSLAKILSRSASILGLVMDEEAAFELARRSRGTPRIANRLLLRARDFAEYLGNGHIDAKTAQMTLQRLEIDQFGLDGMDRRILEILQVRYAGGPVGIETLAATIGEDKTTIEEVYEPFLVSRGFIIRSARGRELSDLGRQHVLSYI